MPEITLRVKIKFPPIDHEGDVNTAEACFNASNLIAALDHYADCALEYDGRYTAVDSLEVSFLGAQKPSEDDIEAMKDWHKEHCAGEDGCQSPGSTEHCPYDWEEEEEEEGLSSFG
jgi:hypothetical protein